MLTKSEINIAKAVVARRKTLWAGYIDRDDALQGAYEGMLNSDRNFDEGKGDRTYFLWRGACIGIMRERERQRKRYGRNGEGGLRNPWLYIQDFTSSGNKPQGRDNDDRDQFVLKYLSCNGTEHRVIVKDLISRISPLHPIVYMHFIKGIPYRHIATVGCKSTQAIQQKADRELKRMRRELLI